MSTLVHSRWGLGETTFLDGSARNTGVISPSIMVGLCRWRTWPGGGGAAGVLGGAKIPGTITADVDLPLGNTEQKGVREGFAWEF